MGQTIKMMKLDYLSLEQKKSGYITFAFLMVMFVVMKSDAMPLFLSVAWYIPLFLLMNLFSTQEKNKLSRLYGSFPLSAKHIVAGRYLLVIFHFALASFAVTLSFVMLSLFQNKVLVLFDLLFAFSASFCAFSLIVSMQMPVYFNMGFTKGKLWSMFPFCVVFVSTYLLEFWAVGRDAKQLLMDHQVVVSVCCIALGILLHFCSYFISFHLYQKSRHWV